MTETALTVVVVLYNSAEELGDCLNSVRTELADTDWAETIIVDNASPDASGQIARGILPDGRLITMESNRGFAAGVNAALKKSAGRYVLLLNPDVVVPTGGLHALVAWMDANPGLAAGTPDVRGADGRSESPARRFPTIWRTALELSRLHKVLPSRVRSRLLMGPYGAGGAELNVDWVPGTAMIVRSEVIAEVGPLSEAMFMYGEDIEWCWRMRRAGYRIGVNANLAYTHRTSSSSLRSWGEPEKNRRIASGVSAACALMYGPGRARLLAAVVGVSIWLEAKSAKHGQAGQEALAAASSTWFDLALRR